MSAEEWQTRVDLAACYRLTAMYGMTEMIANHISCRVPGSHDHFLINPYGMLYEEIDASCLIKVDLDGNILFNASDYGVNAAGFVIHSAIHMARHDVDCVAHTHTPAGMAVSAMECGLLPLAQTSMRFLHIAYHDFEGIADDVGERERLVADLGDHEAMVLRNHGLLVVGRTIPATFNLLYRMERACEVQVMALSCNTKLVYPPQDVLEKTFDKVKPRPIRPTATANWRGRRCCASSTASIRRIGISASELARHDRGRFDLDPRRLFDEAHDLDQRHRGIMRAEDFAIDLPERLQVRQILFDIDDIPGEPNQMFGPRAAFGENGRDVAQGLADLRDKVGRQMTMSVPADHAAGHHEAAVGRHAVGISLRRRPAARLQDLRAGPLRLCNRQHSEVGRLWRAH